MKKSVFLWVLGAIMLLSSCQKEEKVVSFYDLAVVDNHGKEVKMESYKGKVLLVVNTATRCGLTPQYADLQSLYETYKAQGLEILDFPCNQFAEQAPGTDAQIDSFCVTTYHTTFPRFSKVLVNPSEEGEVSTLYSFLKASDYDKQKLVDSMGAVDTRIRWNFTKFLIGKNGQVIERFEPGEGGAEIEPLLRAALSAADGN